MTLNSKRSLIIYCGLLSTMGAVSTDVLLPVFGNMRSNFNTSIELVQLTIPLYTFFLGISQFFMGALSDRFGRKPVIIAGLTLYVFGGFIAMIYPSIELVLFGRAIQGIGGGCGQVIARAMLRDTCSGREYSIALARVMAIFAVGPIVAPLIGALITFGDSWRPAFLLMVTFGFGMLIYAVSRLHETLANKDPEATKIARIWRNTKIVLSDGKAMYLLLIACSAYVALFSYLVNGPAVYEKEFGIVKMEFALLFAFSGLGIIIGQMCNAASINRFGEIPTMRVAAGILVFCSLMITFGGYAGWLTAFSFCALLTLFNTSFLIVFTNSAALIINRHHQIAGFASAVFGVASQVLATSFAALSLIFVDGSATNWGLLLSATTGLSFVLLLFWRHQDF